MTDVGDLVYFRGMAWRPYRNEYEEIDGYYRVTRINRFGLRLTPSGLEGADTEEYDYTVTWQQFEQRPRENS